MARCPNLRDKEARSAFNGVLRRLGGRAMEPGDVSPRQAYVDSLNESELSAYHVAHYLWDKHGSPDEIHSFLRLLDAVKRSTRTSSPESDVAKKQEQNPASGLAAKFADHLRDGGGFGNILAARKMAKEAGFSGDAKAVEEAMELAVVKLGREIAADRSDPKANFTALVDLYSRQPKLGTRTSTSVRDQAYSTPIPLAYVASRLARITPKTTVLEPTAGNGALLVEANPAKAHANELNPGRAENLKSEGFTDVTSDDAATDLSAEPNSVDRVIANPPFGAVRNEGSSRVYDLSDIQPGYETREIDHAIALRALQAMKADGRAVLLVGGVNKLKNNTEKRSDEYNGKAKRQFYKTLYDLYNVTDHFTVSGDLYDRQGAGWPVDMIVIDGRGKSSRALPAVDVPRVLKSWDELGGLIDANAVPERSHEQADIAPDIASESGSGERDVGVRESGGGERVSELQPETRQSGEVQRGLAERSGNELVGGEGRGKRKTGVERGDAERAGVEPSAERRPPGLEGFDQALDNALDETFGKEGNRGQNVQSPIGAQPESTTPSVSSNNRHMLDETTRAKIVAAYNDDLPSIKEQYYKFAGKDRSYEIITAKEAADIYGEREDWPPELADLIDRHGRAVETIEGQNRAAEWHAPDAAPSREAFMRQAVEDEGGLLPAADFDDIMRGLETRTDGAEIAASSAFKELARSLGWKPTQGSRYFTIRRGEGDAEEIISVRISDHANLTRNPNSPGNGSHPDINLAPGAQDFDDAIQILSQPPPSLEEPSRDQGGPGKTGASAVKEQGSGPQAGPKSSQAPRTRPAGEVAKSAAKNAASSADQAMAGLVQLFGGGKSLGSGIHFDEETYAKAKPMFTEAARKFGSFKDDIAELLKRMVAEMHRLHGLTRDVLERMRPYLKRFMEDVRSGIVNLASEKPKAETEAKSKSAKSAVRAQQEQETAHQVTYAPKSRTDGLGMLVPVNMRTPIDESLADLEKRGGNMVSDLPHPSDELVKKIVKRMRHLGAEFVKPSGPEGLPPSEKLASETPEPEEKASVRGADLHLTPKAQQRRADLENYLGRLIQKIAGKSIKIRFSDTVPLSRPPEGWGQYKGGNQVTAAGSYRPAEQLIKIALADPKYTDPLATSFHESYHAVEDVLLNDQEKALLERETPRLREYVANGPFGFKRSELDKIAGYEIRAIAFEQYASGRATGGPGAGMHIGIRRIFEKIRDFIRRLAHALRGLGFQTAEDIFGRTYEGEMAGRPPRRAPKEEMASVRRTDDADEFDRPTGLVRRRIADLFNGPRAASFIEKTQDLSHKIKLLQQDLEKRRGGAFDDPQSFYTKKRLYPGRVATAVDDFNKAHLDPLVKLLHENGISLNQAGDFVYAEHAPERNAEMAKINPATPESGSGMSEAEKILSEVWGSDQEEAYKKLSDRIAGIAEFTRKLMVKSGLESEATVQRWRDRYQHYVPLSGFEEQGDEGVDEPHPARKFNVRGPETEQAFGRKTKADNPIVNIIDQAYRTIDRAERNRYLKSLFLALQSVPRDEIEDMVKFDQGKPRREIDPKTGLVREVDDTSYRFSPNAVAWKTGGKTHYMVFEDRDLAETIKRMSPDGLGMFQGLLNVQNKIKSLWTHYSPDFLLRHFIFRYPIEGTLNSFELKESGKHAVSKYIREAAPFIGDASRAIFAAEKKSDNPRIRQMQHYWDEMRREGGAMTFRSMRDMNLLREHLETQLMSLKGKPVRTVREKWRRAVETIDTVTNALDNALRLAAYASARRQGKSPQEAALIAREATIDYQLKGQWSNILGLWFPFGNVAVQTGARMTKALTRSKIMRYVFMGTILAGFLVAMFNYLVGGNDKDGVPFFEKIPEWDRRLNFIILNVFDKDQQGRPQPIKIPMPYNWALPLVMGYGFGNRLFGSEGTGKQLAMVTKAAIEAVSPLGGEGNKAALLVPELARPFVHAYTNEDWTGRPVHQNPDRQRGLPNAESGRLSTGEGWKTIARGMNSASGGDAAKSGLLDFYPEDLRLIFNQILGTQQRFGENLYQTGDSLVHGERPDATHVPLERVFYGTNYDAADADAYYKKRGETENKAQALRSLVRRRSGGENDAATDAVIERLSSELGAQPSRNRRGLNVPGETVFRASDKEIRQLNLEEDQVRRDDSLTRDQRRVKIDAIREQKRDLMGRARSLVSAPPQ